VQHPGAKMVIEVARTQDDEVGDGTTTAVILVGALMEQAESMLEQGIHPTVIAEGYRKGMEKRWRSSTVSRSKSTRQTGGSSSRLPTPLSPANPSSR